MDDYLQWGITIIVGILGVLAGRKWQVLDNRNKEDKETLKSFLEILPPNGSISYIRETNFGNYFDVDELSDIFNLINRKSDPELTFIDTGLERKRLELIDRIIEFNNELGMKSFPAKQIGVGRLNCIQRPEEIGEEKFKIQMDYFNNLSNDICKSYDGMVIEAKHKLNKFIF